MTENSAHDGQQPAPLLGVGSSARLGLAPERDLVERLREMSRRGHWPLIGDEAADEIERLRGIVPEVLERLNDDLCAENERLRNALRIARGGYASEAATGMPVLPQWRERTLVLIDDALKA